MLFEDSDQSGTFLIAKPFMDYMQYPVPSDILDQPVPLRNLAWGSKPELIDINGDGVADDMDGNGLVDDRDKAWVLTIVPKDLWKVPTKDDFKISFNGAIISCGSGSFSKNGEKNATPFAMETWDNDANAASEKALDQTVDQPGDDLFITVKTSDRPRRFEQFRAVIPATLPERVEGQRTGGVQFYPQVNSSGTAAVKNNPEEDPVGDFYGHDMLEVNVPSRVLDLTSAGQVITIGGTAVPAMGLDISTNRGANGVLASGASGTGAEGVFAVSGAAWAANAFAGDWLVDSGYETYQITGNTANQLALLSGAPRNGTWRIVKDPTFLEQVIVEFYDASVSGNFNPSIDLLPLNVDQDVSGVALYRDNDNNPLNRNGLYDPGVDIPIALDAAPVYIGQIGEDTQVKFVFSTPGTDNVPKSKAQQTRHRQWVPDSFGDDVTNEYTGADFFVVVRASDKMVSGHSFRLGLVSWGPNTPTEPDPDTWASLSGDSMSQYRKFEEFPWGSRALGFITFFKEPRLNYSMIGTKAMQRADSSGFDWMRSHTTVKRRSNAITSRTRPISPTSVVIESANVSQLPSQTLPGSDYCFVLHGSGFGTHPVVEIGGYNVTVTSSTDTDISLCVSTPENTVPVDPVVIIVRNPDTKEEASRSDMFTVKPGEATAPEISHVNPNKGAKEDFPVVVVGKNFAAYGLVQVTFGSTMMPVLAVSSDGTRITVGFPLGGIPESGLVNVKVRNTDKGTESIKVDGFNYINKAHRAGVSCSGEGGGFKDGGFAGDLLVMLLAAAALGVFMRGTRRRAEQK
jgi:hypothetical protein